MEQKQEDRRFYVYIYLNPLKPGKYHYPEINQCFMYEPMYVGKGTKKRYADHIREVNEYYYRIQKWLSLSWEEKNKRSAKYKFFLGWNKQKYRAIHKILKKGQSPIILKLLTNATNSECFTYEQFLIERIGKLRDNTGTLTNKMDAREGSLGGNPNRVKIQKKLYANFTKSGKPIVRKKRKMTEEQKQWLRVLNTGKPSAFKGRKHTPEAKRKNAEKKMGKPMHPATYKSLMGRDFSECNPKLTLTVPVPQILHLHDNGFTTSQTRKFLNIDGLTDTMIRFQVHRHKRKINRSRLNFKSLCYLIQRGCTIEEMCIILNVQKDHLMYHGIRRYIKKPLEIFYEI